MAVIGLDVGTAGCKATVVREDGQAAGYAYQSYELVIPGQGMAELNADIVWQSVKKVLWQAAQGLRNEITAIAVASLGESFVCVGGDDRPLGNSMLYSDVRGTAETQDILAAMAPEALFAVTGMPANPMYTLNKLLWLRKNSDSADRAKWVMLFGDYIGYMLTGIRAIDYSLASRTMFFDVKNKRWATEVTGRFGIDEAKLSRPVLSGETVGELKREVAEELGLSPHSVLVAGAHDQVCAALGAGVLQPGECVDGIGTSECITTMLSANPDGQRMMGSNFCMEPYATAGQYITLAFHPAAGAAVNWHRATIDKERNAASEAGGKNIYAAMEAECSPEPTSLLFVPHLAGTGTPYMDPFACGALLGLTLSTTRGDIYKACLEGVCFEIMVNAELLEDIGTRISGLNCVGGLSRSDMLLQIKADAMGIPVRRLKVKESGTLGLAMLCLVAQGAYRDYAQAAAAMVQPEREFEPDAQRHAIYQEKYRAYRGLYAGLKKLEAR